MLDWILLFSMKSFCIFVLVGALLSAFAVSAAVIPGEDAENDATIVSFSNAANMKESVSDILLNENADFQVIDEDFGLEQIVDHEHKGYGKSGYGYDDKYSGYGGDIRLGCEQSKPFQCGKKCHKITKYKEVKEAYTVYEKKEYECGYSDDKYGYSDDKHGYSDDKHGYSDDKYGYSDDKYGYSDDKYSKHDDSYGPKPKYCYKDVPVTKYKLIKKPYYETVCKPWYCVKVTCIKRLGGKY
mmetsp:Transcript_27699/g.27920  ORF Transcript_27699/g.27920 Transcript_27699/m.27920 type:complete len:241 (-) Transcript_27699:280-1002(-)